MKKKIIAVLIGLIIIAIGVIVIGNGAFGWGIDIFIDGWWAALLMVVFLIFIINDGPNFFNVIGLVLFGVLFARYYIPLLKDVNVWLIIGGVLILCVGVRLIYRAFAPKKVTVKVNTQCETPDGESTEEVEVESNNCTFSSGESKFAGKTFAGGKYSCSFGSYKVDLRGATVTKGAELDLHCSFGEIKVTVPAGSSVKLVKDSVFGTVNCSAPVADNGDLVVKAECAFGSINIISE